MADRFQITRVGAGAGARLVGLPRDGYRHLAIPAGGPVDPLAYRAAIDLLGLPPGSHLLELPLRGGSWRVEGPCSLAFTGADFGWSIDGNPTPTNAVTPILSPGTIIVKGGYAPVGQYGYLAARGTIVLERENVLAEFTPWVVRDGQTLTFATQPALPRPPVTTQVHSISPDDPVVIPVYTGPESSWLSAGQRKYLTAAQYVTRPDSNRQGIRLQIKDDPTDTMIDLPTMISSPVLPGTVQLTPSGPIILGPDAQTVGGYPRVGIVRERALAILYQHRLGARVRLSFIDWRK